MRSGAEGRSTEHLSSPLARLAMKKPQKEAGAERPNRSSLSKPTSGLLPLAHHADAVII